MIARVLKAAGVALACAALAVLSCSPVAAVELPDHQRLSTIDANTGIFYEIVPTTGDATALWDTGLEGAQALSLDASGRGFATTNTGPAWQSSLWAVDVTTQSVTEIAPITLAGNPDKSGICHSLQQSGGTLYAYCGFYEYPGGTNTYSVIDQATGEFTPLFVFSTGGSEDVIPTIDPADGTVFFAASSHLYLLDLETFDPTAPEGVAQFRVAEFPGFVGSGNFSEGSVLWVPLPDYLTQSTRLATWDRTTGEVQVVGNIAASAPVYSYVVAVWGAAPDVPDPVPAPAAAPELAATGSSPAPLLLVGSGILVLVGALLVVRRRAA